MAAAQAAAGPPLPGGAAVMVDGPAEGHRPHPRLGVVVAAEDRPAHQRAREGVLDGVLGLGPVVQERVQQPDQPAIAGREELLEAPVAALAYRWLLVCGGTPLSRHRR